MLRGSALCILPSDSGFADEQTKCNSLRLRIRAGATRSACNPLAALAGQRTPNPKRRFGPQSSPTPGRRKPEKDRVGVRGTRRAVLDECPNTFARRSVGVRSKLRRARFAPYAARQRGAPGLDWCPSRSRRETAPSSARYRGAETATCAIPNFIKSESEPKLHAE